MAHRGQPERAGWHLEISPEVAEALGGGAPVVALESTIITHGLPHPLNEETALKAESLVREAGAVPATVAVIDGRMRAGLDRKEIVQLASQEGAMKASRRDIAALLVKKATAGTTVAATMFIAALARIPLFATGGTGGVHRGAETSFDISADLAELARTPVAVVSAGVKSILDIGKTMELLESLSVPVIGLRTSEFPSFFSRRSGIRLDHRFDRVEDIAAVMARHWELGSRSGLLIANPIPEAHEIEGRKIEAAIAAAVSEAQASGIAQKAVTPFLLSRLVEMTGGASLRANVDLICNNARTAAEIAVAFARLRRK
jgi:pseudouridine-5'-phosphate glycosidase